MVNVACQALPFSKWLMLVRPGGQLIDPGLMTAHTGRVVCRSRYGTGNRLPKEGTPCLEPKVPKWRDQDGCKHQDDKTYPGTEPAVISYKVEGLLQQPSQYC